MKRLLLAISLLVGVTPMVSAQTTKSGASTSANSQASVEPQGRQIALQSGTQLAAQLENSLDVRHAKAGDRVVLKTTQAIKQNGQTVIAKGARLIGRVTDVQQQMKSTGESHISIVFDRLRSGATEMPITASILSITQARSSARADNAGTETVTMSQSSVSTRAGTSGSGGLLGGVGNTAAGVLNTTMSNSTGAGSAQ